MNDERGDVHVRVDNIEIIHKVFDVIVIESLEIISTKTSPIRDNGCR